MKADSGSIEFENEALRREIDRLRGLIDQCAVVVETMDLAAAIRIFGKIQSISSPPFPCGEEG